MNEPREASEQTPSDRRSSRLDKRVITMSLRPGQRPRRRQRRAESSSGTARRHSERVGVAVRPGSSTFLRSLRSMAITPLRRYYGRSDSCSGRSPALGLWRDHCLLSGQVSLIHSPDLPTVPSPTTCESPGRLGTPGRRGPDSPPQLRGDGASLRMSRLAVLAGRIEFSFLPYGGDFLRPGRSPPAAPHPVSRRRSCRLVTAWRWIPLERTFTSLIRCALRRTHSRESGNPFSKLLETGSQAKWIPAFAGMTALGAFK